MCDWLFYYLFLVVLLDSNLIVVFVFKILVRNELVLLICFILVGENMFLL